MITKNLSVRVKRIIPGNAYVACGVVEGFPGVVSFIYQ